MSVLEISKWLPEPESVSAPEGTKYNPDLIVLPVAAEMVKGHSSEGKTPTLSLRPVEDNSALAKIRQNILLNIVMPDWADHD
jgi:hypothetical protein